MLLAMIADDPAMTLLAAGGTRNPVLVECAAC